MNNVKGDITLPQITTEQYWNYWTSLNTAYDQWTKCKTDHDWAKYQERIDKLQTKIKQYKNQPEPRTGHHFVRFIKSSEDDKPVRYEIWPDHQDYIRLCKIFKYFPENYDELGY